MLFYHLLWVFSLHYKFYLSHLEDGIRIFNRPTIHFLASIYRWVRCFVNTDYILVKLNVLLEMTCSDGCRPSCANTTAYADPCNLKCPGINQYNFASSLWISGAGSSCAQRANNPYFLTKCSHWHARIGNPHYKASP